MVKYLRRFTKKKYEIERSPTEIVTIHVYGEPTKSWVNVEIARGLTLSYNTRTKQYRIWLFGKHGQATYRDIERADLRRLQYSLILVLQNQSQNVIQKHDKHRLFSIRIPKWDWRMIKHEYKKWKRYSKT